MGNQNKRTVDIGQTNQIAEWRESNNAWSATSFLSKNKTFRQRTDSARPPKRASESLQLMRLIGERSRRETLIAPFHIEGILCL